VWQLDGTGRAVRLTGATEVVKAVGWTADGARIVTVAADGLAFSWRADGTGAGRPAGGRLGAIEVVTISGDGRRFATVAEDAVLRRDGELADLVSLRWDAMDHWFEEDEEIYVHARSPEVRVDALAGHLLVVVEIDGTVIADSRNAVALFETGLPTRWYLPKTDVRMDLLTPTASASACPYKGVARYWSVTVDGATHDDIVWGYDAPLAESAAVVGRVAFYDEKVDVTIDGVRQERPVTKFA